MALSSSANASFTILQRSALVSMLIPTCTPTSTTQPSSNAAHHGCEDPAPATYLCLWSRGLPTNFSETITVSNMAPQPPEVSTISCKVRHRQSGQGAAGSQR